MNDILLYGPPAAGKTTLGKLLANRLGYDFVDLDAVIEDEAGCSIREIFAREGEAGFRALEARLIASLVGSVPNPVGSVPNSEGSVPRDLGSVPNEGRVVSLGGGSLLNSDSREFCEKNGEIICLEAPPSDEINRRLKLAPGSRPLGNKATERAEHYAAFPRRITDFFEVNQSLVIVGQGIALPLLKNARIVVDGNVRQLYGQWLPRPTAEIPSGEANKTPATVMRLWQEFSRAGVVRKDLVAAVGGGVTGDLTGFAAATWMRGVDWINVPTTLLSMVDAAIGGKTGCDLPEGKNLVGAFHQPRLVIVDTNFLETLSSAQIAAGRAEMIKHEILAGIKSSGVLAAAPSAREIADSLKVKAEIVRQDPCERDGKRILLNCGHTVAHALEKISDYRIVHGEAVAMGCVAEARLAVRLGMAPATWPDELATRFRAAGLPTELPPKADWTRMCPIMQRDKKRTKNAVEFALPCGWGDVRSRTVDLARVELS